MDDPASEQIEAVIRDLLTRRAPGKTICPSEAARVMAGDDDFRPLMTAVRATAADMASRGAIEITQAGQIVDIATARGPIRLRLPSPTE